jgi:hypothetical protein
VADEIRGDTVLSSKRSLFNYGVEQQDRFLSKKRFFSQNAFIEE